MTPAAAGTRLARSIGIEEQAIVDRRQVVRQASEFFRRHAADSVHMGDVSKAAGVSERTLRTAFHLEHGLSPKRYDVRERLHAARRALCDVSRRRTVTAIASQFGFFELGRFAVMYKHAFGESPSQTLKAHRRMTGSASLA
jgi:AraC-like DNA-binding protein